MLRTLLLLGLILGWRDAQAASTSHDPLDTAHVVSLYLGGDFDQGIKWIDSHLAGPIPLTHADSVFGLKYLGVMQAANYAAWEAGKNDLRRLLTIEPSASIDALGASDRINAMFHDLQNKTSTRPRPDQTAPTPASARNMTAADSAATAAAGNAERAHGSSTSTNRTSNNTWLWVAGGVGAAAAGTALVLWISSGNNPPAKQTITVSN